jgi:hypothetical protein
MERSVLADRLLIKILNKELSNHVKISYSLLLIKRIFLFNGGLIYKRLENQ